MVALALLLLTACATAAPGRASYGELSRFGSKGTAAGQFVERPGTVAFGVDPSDNSVYVGDEPEANVFRIQRLSASGTPTAETSFKLKGTTERPAGIEGIAVDSVSQVIYVLATQTRREQNAEETVPDPELTAAGSLYAFSTAGEKLEPAAGTKETEGKKQGLLVALHGESDKIGEALIEPRGIALDPVKHEVIVMGKEDRGTVAEPSLRVALERVTAKGAIGARYVDKGAEPFFAEEGEEASSPVVTSAGKVYVVGGALEIAGELVEEIDEIPSDFTSSEEPAPFVHFDPGPGFVVTFPGLPLPSMGGGLSIAPDTGNLWAFANIEREEKPGVFNHARGALEFGKAGEEIGWTGGQTWTLKSGTAPVECAASFLGHPIVAAGKEERVFVFDTNPEAPWVIQFGPGGKGCPTASLSVPSAKVGGKPVSPIPPNAEVVFSSNVTQANAKSVEWNFGDGTSPVKAGNQHQVTEATHKFTKEGTFTVTETVESDNLATPTLVQSLKVTVEPPHPIAQFSSPSEAKVGQPVTFDGKNSSDPNGETLEYSWNFGDGSAPTSSTTPTATHTYAAEGKYTVTLTVKETKGGLTGKAERAISVVAEKPSTGGGGGTVSGGSTTSGSSTTSSGSGGGGGSVAVLPYSVSLAGTALAVSKSGTLALKVNCSGRSNCAGTVTLRTLNAVSAGGKRKAVLTLASASFTLAGGQVKTLPLHLSSRARQLLKRLHTLRARATIVAKDSQGSSHTTAFVVTLRAAKRKH